jgi:hypothetical protein
VRLAISSLILGVVFVAIGLGISSFGRTRVRSLVFALLAWGLAVFVFDLVALGIFMSAKGPSAAKEIDIVCDATHVNTSADLHSAFDNLEQPRPRSETQGGSPSIGWLALNPVDLFRIANLGAQLGVRTPAVVIALSTSLWIGLALGLSVWKLRRIDL